MQSLDNLFRQFNPATEQLLTPNNRLASYLQAQYAKQQSSTTWSTPPILPYQAWLNQLWQQLLDQGLTEHLILLTPTQSKLIWQEIIAEQTQEQLLNTQATADQAMQAWQLLQQWQLELDAPRLISNSTQEHFIEWARHYEQRCQQCDWLDPHCLAQYLTQHAEALSLPSQLRLVNFLELRPDMAVLFSAINEYGCAHQSHQLKQTSNQQVTHACPTVEIEIQQMAHWAKQAWLSDSTLEIACIIPDLSQRRAQVEALFEASFQAELDQEGPSPFSISGGEPLSETPLLFAAFTALQCNYYRLPLATVTQLLQSPFLISDENELHLNALFSRAVKQTRQHHFSLKQLIKLAKVFKGNLPLIDRWQSLLDYQLPKSAATSHWAEHFSRLLKLMGWPGYRSLTSAEYQLSQRWLSLLDEFASLDQVTEPLSFAQALQQLKQLASNQLFQPESDSTRIHVLGLLEAVGIPFNQAWIMGMDNASWPTQALPSPFISIELQQALGLPHCSPQRELNFCQLVTEQLMQANEICHFSYAQQQEAEQMSLSPLLQDLEKQALPEMTLSSISALSTEQHSDQQAPAILPGEKVRGGTGVIKQQSACPFRAFSLYRLKARAAEEPEVGIDARSKGILLHKALELFWKQTKSHYQLDQLIAGEQLDEVLQPCIAQAFSVTPLSTSNKALIQLEQQRLNKLLTRWLLKEQQREPFKVIANEQWQHVKLGRLSLHVQIDRIDQLNNGQHVLVDYKTGLANPSDWFGHRPNEPQLPLYACTHSYPVAGLAFAQLRTNDLRFKGVVIDEMTLTGCTPLTKVRAAETNDWAEQLKQWQAELKRLANEFMAGVAKVDPKNAHQTCQHCDFKPLCRVSSSFNSSTT